MTKSNPQSRIPSPQTSIPNPSHVLNPEVRKKIESLFVRYPTKQAVTLPALHIVNDALGYVPREAVVELAAMLELSPAQVQDTLSFYGFFKQEGPMGKYNIQVCRSITCEACGGDDMLEYLTQKLGIQPGETTPDGQISLEFAECLGACDTAPTIMVNDTLYGEMTKEKVDELIREMK